MFKKDIMHFFSVAGTHFGHLGIFGGLVAESALGTLSYIKIAVMLSHPNTYFVSLANMLSIKSDNITPISFFVFI